MSKSKARKRSKKPENAPQAAIQLRAQVLQTGKQPNGRVPYGALREVGELGVTGLLEASNVARHVESIEFENDRDFKRRLTIDIDLPETAELGVDSTAEGLCVYELPVALLDKQPARSNIDLTDETGRKLPLRTRYENAEITRAAMISEAERMEGGPLEELYTSRLGDVIHETRLEAEYSFELTLVAAHTQHPALVEHPDWDRYERLLFDLQGLSVIWVRIEGLPGQRRVLKLCYDAAAEVAPTVDARPETLQVTVKTAHTDFVFPYQVLPERSFARWISGVTSRCLIVLGLSPIDWLIESPHMSRCRSYHMQIEAPSGLRIHRPELLGPVDVEEYPGSRIRLDGTSDETGAQLYVAGLRLTTQHKVAASISVGRRGFLSLSMASAAITTGLLWAFVLASPNVTMQGSHQDVAGSVLVVTPALLAAFVVRPGEHTLATRLLSGVRLLVLLCGLLSVVAAAMLAGVRPDGWSLHRSWVWMASISSVATGVIALAWLRSFDVLGKQDARDVPRIMAAGVSLLSAVPIGLALGVQAHFPESWISSRSVLLVLLLAAVVVAEVGRRLSWRAVGGWPFILVGLCWLVIGLAAAALARPAGFTPFDLSGSEQWSWIAWILVAGCTAAVMSEVVRARRGADEA